MPRKIRNFFTKIPQIPLKRRPGDEQCDRSRISSKNARHFELETPTQIDDEIDFVREEEDGSLNDNLTATNVEAPIEGGEELSIKDVSDEVLAFLGSNCLARSTDADFKRYLSCHTDSLFRKHSIEIWNKMKSPLTIIFICNKCGIKKNRSDKCCGPIIKYVRMNGFSQLKEIVEHNFQHIRNTRRELKTGNDKKHNLNGSFLRQLWELEKNDTEWHLSLVMSIDGVKLDGNSKLKIWPVTCMVIDLPTTVMQRVTNVVLCGIAEGPVNPSTAFWNSVIPLLFVDIENQKAVINGVRFGAYIITCSADQPAKRSLYGFAGHNSELSCFYGLCTGTFHKKTGKARYVDREGKKTEDDALQCQNGFISSSPAIIKHIYPYDSVIDILHNGPEGLLGVILNELMDQNANRKSEIFRSRADLKEMAEKSVVCPPEYRNLTLRNGTEKLSYFRLIIGFFLLTKEELCPEGTVTIASLMLLMNQMHTNGDMPDGFCFRLCSAATNFLEKASPRYLTIKSHELLSHLPYAMHKFGNPAPLATFTFESYYKFSLKGFNPQLTNSFIETASARTLLHLQIRRELEIRTRSKESSKCLEEFLAHTPDLKPFRQSWRSRITKIEQIDCLDDLRDKDHYAIYSSSSGKFVSSYADSKTSSDIIFCKADSGFVNCYRFISIIPSEDALLLEEITRISPSDQFPIIQKVANGMNLRDSAHAFHILSCLKNYSGLLHGRFTGNRITMKSSSIQGAGAYINAPNGFYFLQINGCCIHN